MRNRTVNVLVLTAGVLVLALIVVQLLWLVRAQDQQKRSQELKVKGIINDITNTIEESTSCVNFFTKYRISPGEGFYISRQKWNDKEQFYGANDTVSFYYDFAEYRGSKEEQDKIPYKYKNVMTTIPADVEMNITIHFLPDKNRQPSDVYTDLKRDNYKDVLASGTKLSDLIELSKVDSIIKNALNAADMPDRYSFAFLKGDEIVYTLADDTSVILMSEYRAPLFEDNRFVSDYTLVIAFSGIEKVSTINILMIISLLIISLLIISFYRFLKIYRKQTKLSQMKTDFINNLTHEFNTPMTNISLAVETIHDRSESNDAYIDKLLGVINAESKRLQNNIERALNVASIESGKYILKSEQVNICELLDSIETSYKYKCEQLGGRLNILCSGDNHAKADETHLLNCICNLLDNAIKYSKAPPDIKVEVKRISGYITISVADRGIGISKDVQKHIFDKFYRSSEGDIHNTKGFGLGLSYVKSIIKAMGGTVTVRSKVGEGSVFLLKLREAK